MTPENSHGHEYPEVHVFTDKTIVSTGPVDIVTDGIRAVASSAVPFKLIEHTHPFEEGVKGKSSVGYSKGYAEGWDRIFKKKSDQSDPNLS